MLNEIFTPYEIEIMPDDAKAEIEALLQSYPCEWASVGFNTSDGHYIELADASWTRIQISERAYRWLNQSA